MAPNLELLSLSSTYNRDAEALCALLHNCKLPALRSLMLAIPGVSSAAVALVVEAFPHLHHLSLGDGASDVPTDVPSLPVLNA